MANWERFDDDLLIEIARLVKSNEDLTRFSMVCTSWRCAAERVTCFDFPWLILPPTDCSFVIDFFNVPKGTTACIRTLSQVVGKKYYSSKGWLLTISQDFSIELLHPFSLHPPIKLPHLKTFKDWKLSSTMKPHILFISKFFLSADPLLTSDYTVMVIQSCKGMLAYCKPGDKAWTTIDTHNGRYFDITLYKGLFYALDCCGRIMVCDVNGDNPTIAHHVTQLNLSELHLGFLEYGYIVECGGKLLVVTREGVQYTIYNTFRFQVFDLDLRTKKLSEIKDLGKNRALFLGHNSSFSLDTSDIPDCKPNCIYFTDDGTDAYWSRRGGGGKDMGIYNLQDGRVVPLFCSRRVFSRLNPPMWVKNRISYN